MSKKISKRALIWIGASVAVASTFWVVLEVAFDAAAFDATRNLPHVRPGFVDLPTFHERYLIYVVPFFLVALFAAFDLRRVGVPALVGSAAVAALLPALVPFGTVVNGSRRWLSLGITRIQPSETLYSMTLVFSCPLKRIPIPRLKIASS